MKDNLILSFSDFSDSLNEGNSHKKGFGILGPFDKWGYKIKTCCSGMEEAETPLISCDMESDPSQISLKYSYGNSKESDPVYFPKDSFIVSGSSKNPIIETKGGIRFWDDESNQSNLDEFINSFIESKHFAVPEEDMSGDLNSILEIIGIDSTVIGIEKKKNLHWIAKLEDGTEIEIRKKDEDDFLHNLKIYLNADSYAPEIEVYRDKPGFETIFNTPKGKIIRKTPRLTDLSKEPIHQYLFNSSLKRNPELYQEPVMNYLNSILKSHDWRPELAKQANSFSEGGREIAQLKKILSNTMSEENLDEIYSKARETHSMSVKPRGN
jgi:hypothetical protein